MRYFRIINESLLLSCRSISVILLLLTLSLVSVAQEPPPRPLEVAVTRDLGFGAFTYGLVGGTVVLAPDGTRTKTGDVILLNFALFATARFSLTANPGTVVSILNGPDAILSGNNGGSLTLHIGGTNPASPFVIATTPPGSTTMFLGGTLTVGTSASNPPGSYSGTFNLTFIQE